MNKQLTEFYKQAFGYPPAPSGEPELEKFAALVADAEREACAKVADDYAENQQAWSYGLDSPEEYRMQAGHECADAIRARGEGMKIEDRAEPRIFVAGVEVTPELVAEIKRLMFGHKKKEGEE